MHTHTHTYTHTHTHTRTHTHTHRSLDAINEADSDRLTPLGFHLAALPVDVRIGKMLIFGAILGVTEPVLTMAAAMGLRSPFMAPIDKREEADKMRKAMGANHSDHLTTLRAYEGWQQAKVQGRREASILKSVANVLRMCCEYVTNVLRMRCECVANVLRMCCECVANVLLRETWACRFVQSSKFPPRRYSLT